MIAGILKEPSGENRVSLLPEAAEALQKKNITVIAETGAGVNAWSNDEAYEAKGIKTLQRTALFAQADLIFCIQPPTVEELSTAKKGLVLIGVFQPLFHAKAMAQWAEAGITSFSLDMLPRTTRAQSMDVLSSQANIAGYKAVLLAAHLYPRYFPMFMTAAGSIPPAKVLILGAGVAGLQAIATAKRLGAVVEVFDTRPAVKDEVQSLGAKFIEIEGAADASTAGGYAVEQTEAYKQRQQQKIADSLAKADIVITTAQIPGKKAPILISEEMLNGMKSGSIIIDIAAATGGNTPLTQNNQTVIYKGISIVGNSNLPAQMPADASKLYGKNLLNFLQLITTKEGDLNLNFADDLVQGACITHHQLIVNERITALL
jgi:H+-translocating NAD(P) transhydrogenase subunit alpha